MIGSIEVYASEEKGVTSNWLFVIDYTEEVQHQNMMYVFACEWINVFYNQV